MANKLGFYFNGGACTGCKACQIACKDKSDLPIGVNWRRVAEYTGGEWVTNPDGSVVQNVFAYYTSMACNHCENPICAEVCPTQAMFKREDGVVMIDESKCIGCRYCEWACPYGAPQFDPSDNTVKKCNLCIDELESGRKPYCVSACMMRVLDIGPIDQLRAGTWDTKAMVKGVDVPVRQVQHMANPELTNPSIVFVAHPKGKVESAPAVPAAPTPKASS